MARSDSFVDTLATVPLFSACSKKELQMVAKSAERVTVPAGKVVVNEGAAGTEFFVILDGPGPGRAPRPPGRGRSDRAASSATSPCSTARRATRA